MLSVAVTVVFMVHLMSCFWFIVAKFEDFGPNTWVTKFEIVDAENSF